MVSPEPRPSGEGGSSEDVWAEIVANYGERAVLEPEPEPEPEPAEPVVSHVFGDDVDEEPAWEDDDDDLLLPGSFVAPDPEPLGWNGWRSMAWVGLLGSPVLALIWTLLAQLTDWVLPSLIGYGLVAIFLGCFGYLVATMPRGNDDPWDDGARV